MIKLASFLRNTSGNTAMMFALAVVPMLLGVGAAVDIVQANNVRTIVQSAADAAALAGATSGKTSPAELKVIVDDYVKANGVQLAATIEDVTPKLDTAASTFSVRVKSKAATNFMFLAGITEMDTSAFAEVSLSGGALEVVLALDTTESMNAAGRLPALKTAANGLVNTILANSSGYARVGIVPFAKYVNVGKSRKGETWLDVTGEGPAKYCSNSYPDAYKFNCRIESWINYADGVPTPVTGEVCDWNWGAPVTSCSTVNYEWQGCVGSRHHPLDTKLVGLGDKYPGLTKESSNTYNIYCSQEITTLTDDKSLLNSRIDALWGGDNTYIAPGILWGWNMLTSDAPLTEAKTKSWMTTNKGTKALIVMTDGQNTLSANYPFHEAGDATEANKITEDVCKNVKKDDIVVYTVAFMVTDATAKDLLKGCASDSSKAFTADDPAALISAFEDITRSLMTFRLTK